MKMVWKRELGRTAAARGFLGVERHHPIAVLHDLSRPLRDGFRVRVKALAAVSTTFTSSCSPGCSMEQRWRPCSAQSATYPSPPPARQEGSLGGKGGAKEAGKGGLSNRLWGRGIHCPGRRHHSSRPCPHPFSRPL